MLFKCASFTKYIRLLVSKPFFSVFEFVQSALLSAFKKDSMSSVDTNVAYGKSCISVILYTTSCYTHQTFKHAHSCRARVGKKATVRIMVAIIISSL